MIESFKQIWDIIKGRVITDLNLIGIIVLMWIVSHSNANVLPLIGDLPSSVQPIAKFIVPIVWWAICQYCIVLNRTQSVIALSQTHQAEIEHIRDILARDYADIHANPSARVILTDAANVVIPAAETIIDKEIPIAAPLVDEAVRVVEQAVGLGAVGAAPNPAGGVVAHTPPVIISPVVVAPATNTGTNV